MSRPKKLSVEENLPIYGEEITTEPTEKDKLLILYAELKERNIRSISDLENLIARCE